MSRSLCASIAVVVSLSIACEAAPTDACEGVSVAAASAPDRRLLGAGADYPADTALAASWPDLTASQRERRRIAWEAIARVLAPIPLTEPTLFGETTVPRFRTFHDRDDFNRIFQHLYGALTPEQRAARTRFPTETVDVAFSANTRFLETLGTWGPERWSEYIASFTSEDRLASIGGIRRISTSPALTRHLVESYPDVLRCLEAGAPPAFVPRVSRTDRLMRTEVLLGECESRRFGPFAITRDETLRASLEGARVSIAEGPTSQVRCEAPDTCAVSGPGLFTVEVQGEGALEGMLEIDRDGASPVVGCLAGALPLDAVSIAAEWRRIGPEPLPVYDTSAERLAEIMARAEPTWGDGEATAMPSPDEIYTQRLPGGEVYVLAGMHVRTRELPLGLHITLWWSDEPELDFGADRPASIRALGGPWSHYKMCVAVEHTELDPEPNGGFASDAPSLADALAAVHEGRGGPTWCSNPYIDAAPGLARGNCVGCHQHAMSGVRPGEVATQPTRFPSSGRLAARNNYPSDGFWGLDAGDELAGVLRDVVEHWQ